MLYVVLRTRSEPPGRGTLSRMRQTQWHHYWLIRASTPEAPEKNRILGPFLFLMLYCSALFAQPAPMVPAEPYENHGLYSIGLQDLRIVMNIPIRNKPGFNANFTGALNYNMVGSTLIPMEVNLVSGGRVNGFLGNNARLSWSSSSTVLCPNGVTQTHKYIGWYYVDANGTTHSLPSSDYIDTETVGNFGVSCLKSSFGDRTTDYAFGISVTTGVSGGSEVVTARGGTVVLDESVNPFAGALTSLSIKDRNGNITSTNSTYTTFTDVMNTNPLTSTGITGAPTFSWTDVNGGTQRTTINTTSLKRKTSYGCSLYPDILDTTAQAIMSGVTFPDSTLSMTYEANGSGYTTGRLAGLTLPGGGTVAFAYSGFNCNYLQTTQMTVTTSDGTWTYAWEPATYGTGPYTYGSSTTVTDPAGNFKTYYFIGLPSAYSGAAQNITSVQVQEFPKGGSTQRIVAMCYNNVLTNCTSTVPTTPITRVDSYVTLPGMSTSQHSIKTLSTQGDVLSVINYDYNGTTYDKRVNTYNGFDEILTSVFYYNSATEVSGVTNTYDSSGDLLTANTYMPGNTTLTTTNTYNTNGTVATSKNAAGITTTYTWGDCNGFALTTITVGSLSTSKTYGTVGCNGGVPVTSTDLNGKVTIYGYANTGGVADPYYRLMSVTDSQSNVVYKTYSPTSLATSFSFNSSLSENNTTTTLDGYGRRILSQSSGVGFTLPDTVSYSYGYSTTGGLGAFSTVSIPCSAGTGSGCTYGITTAQYDYMGRPSTITDGGSGVRTFTYNQNDTELTISPAPSGENTKSVLSERNGLGMVSVICPLTSSSGGSSCGENTTGTGYPKASTFSAGVGTYTIQTTLGSQSRTQVFDAAGRLTSLTIPEYNGNSDSYTYDSASGCSGTLNGRLAKKVDAKGNVLCFAYDTYGRLSQVSANGSLYHLYFYDNSVGFSGTMPTGITINNPLGHLVEAATSNCSTTLLTDEWFSYDSLGRTTDTWEMTPHSGAYYHATDTYFANNVPNTEDFVGNFATTYSIDGKGRWTSATIGSANTVASVSYNAAQQPTQIAYPTGEVNTTTTAAIAAHASTFTVASTTNIVVNQMLIVDPFGGPGGTEEIQVGSIAGSTITLGGHLTTFRHNHNSGVAVQSTVGDADNYIYDANTGRMTQFQFTSSASESNGSLTGALTWNANGTLSQLALTDTVNSGGTQTCAFLYDDLGRIDSDLCGTGASSYRSTMTYDQYGNVTKSSSNGTGPTWPITGGYSSTTNRYTASTATYDNGGSTLSDYFHTYTWDGFNRMSAIDGEGMTYDALGRVVELNNAGSYTEFWYTPIGTKAVMSGSTMNLVHLPMPGGTSADWTPSATSVHHKDWLGNSRVTTQAGVFYSDKAFGAYGEDTAQDFGSTTQFNYTGDSQDIKTAMYDAFAREYMPVQGRWPSVDPTHSKWNGYAYASNPLSFIDPSGLDDEGGGDDGGGGVVASPDPVETITTIIDQTVLDGGTSLPDAPSPTGEDSGATCSCFIPASVWGPSNVIEMSLVFDGSMSLPTTAGSLSGFNPATGTDSSDVDISMNIAANVAALAPAMQQGAAFANTVTKYTGYVYGAVASTVVGIPAALGVAARGFGWYYGLAGGSGVVLGLYEGSPNYLDVAEQMGANALNASPGVYNFFSAVGEWTTLNQSFLDASIARGQQFYLSTAPYLSGTGNYAMELGYLMQNGVGPEQWLMASGYVP